MPAPNELSETGGFCQDPVILPYLQGIGQVYFAGAAKADVNAVITAN